MPPLLCLFPSLCATLASWHWPLTFKPQVIFFFPESVPNSPNMWLNHCPMHLIVVQSRSHGTPRTVAHQALLSMGFPRQGYWSRLLFPSPGKLPQPKDWTRISCIGSGSLPLSHLGRPYASDTSPHLRGSDMTSLWAGCMPVSTVFYPLPA